MKLGILSKSRFFKSVIYNRLFIAVLVEVWLLLVELLQRVRQVFVLPTALPGMHFLFIFLFLVHVPQKCLVIDGFCNCLLKLGWVPPFLVFKLDRGVDCVDSSDVSVTNKTANHQVSLKLLELEQLPLLCVSAKFMLRQSLDVVVHVDNSAFQTRLCEYFHKVRVPNVLFAQRGRQHFLQKPLEVRVRVDYPSLQQNLLKSS